jgi:hypothetical protein
LGAAASVASLAVEEAAGNVALLAGVMFMDDSFWGQPRNVGVVSKSRNSSGKL